MKRFYMQGKVRTTGIKQPELRIIHIVQLTNESRYLNMIISQEVARREEGRTATNDSSKRSHKVKDLPWSRAGIKASVTRMFSNTRV